VIDQIFVGKTYAPIRYQVGTEKIREYAGATLDRSPHHWNGEFAPPMFAVVYSARLFLDMLFDPDLAMELGRIVHGEQSFEFLGLARPGDEIVSRGRVAKIFEKRGNDFVVFESSSTRQGGEELLRARWTFVVRGGGVDPAPLAEAKTDLARDWLVPGLPPPDLAGDPTARRRAAEVKVGARFEHQRFVDRYRPILYAGAAGDFNPIHIDPAYGREVGLGGNILQGLCTMAFAAQAASEFAGDPRALEQLRVRFAAPVRPGDTIHVHGEVSAVEGSRARCALHADNQHGAPVLSRCEAVLALAAS